MRRSTYLPLSLSLSISIPSLVAAANVQKAGLTLPSDAASNAQLVKDVFLDAYGAYKDKAWGHDDLAPVSGGFKDTRNGWGSSVFDALGTLKIMGEEDLFQEAVEYATRVDFSKSNTDDHVSLFESTIRYLGALLAAFDLSSQSSSALLTSATFLADKLLYAYPVDSGYVTPVGSVDFSTNTPDVGDGGPNGLAAAASNILEFYKLSQYTGNGTYLKFADMTMRAIASNPNPVFPGLPPLQVNKDGSGVGSTVNWDGGYDSYLEYLLKYARLTNFADDPLWAKTWTDAVESSITHLVKQSSGGDKLYFLTSYDSEHGSSYSMGDLACFAGGNWIMGGKLLDRDDFVDWGLKITDACISTYFATSTGLGPGGWAFKGADGGGADPPSEQKEFFEKNGFWITSADYNVRPEVFESAFYAWRATGDRKYYDFAADGIKAMQKYMKSNFGYAPLKDVMRAEVTTDNQGDDLESFFFAEVMKYLYLTFDDPEHISLDTWVFNTESHPFLPANATSTDPPSPTTTTLPEPSETDSGDEPCSGDDGNESPAPEPTATIAPDPCEDDEDDDPSPPEPTPTETDPDPCEDDEDEPQPTSTLTDPDPCEEDDEPEPAPTSTSIPVPPQPTEEPEPDCPEGDDE
ncbi:seven-hairpin glycosidase [Exidia glandulosa HHB12029]|uniref:alpha-1,2-Mannosidase n=1 Tax=Exidia glandulosa HHB12029 TaxID=1314781 RepID=A0A165NRC6_EXIGL|nr:seven-hairpin glycosidase [Exidia glandulosa HHB12029]